VNEASVFHDLPLDLDIVVAGEDVAAVDECVGVALLLGINETKKF
jgi:hypothetical protein